MSCIESIADDKRLRVYYVSGKDCGQGYSGPPYKNLRLFGIYNTLEAYRDVWDQFDETRFPLEYSEQQWRDAFANGKVTVDVPKRAKDEEEQETLILLLL